MNERGLRVVFGVVGCWYELLVALVWGFAYGVWTGVLFWSSAGVRAVGLAVVYGVFSFLWMYGVASIVRLFVCTYERWVIGANADREAKTELGKRRFDRCVSSHVLRNMVLIVLLVVAVADLLVGGLLRLWLGSGLALPSGGCEAVDLLGWLVGCYDFVSSFVWGSFPIGVLAVVFSLLFYYLTFDVRARGCGWF